MKSETQGGWLQKTSRNVFMAFRCRSMFNNIHEQISPFWLVKSSAVFLKTVQKRVNLVQKEETNQAFWLVNDQRNSQMANQIFCFQSMHVPWMVQFFPDCVIRVRFFCLKPSRNFFMYIINK